MAVEVMSLYKSFGENKVLEDVNFSLEEGKIYALVGRNGSGKTTLLKVMADIFQKDLGKVNVFGKSCAEDKILHRQGLFVFLYQNLFQNLLIFH